MIIKVHNKVGGFTLLEILSALAISSIVMLGSYSVLDSVLRTDERLSEQRQKLEILQRAFHVIQQDVEQIIDRPVRSNVSENENAIIYTGLENKLEFTRLGWRNPIGRTRSNMQRVAYVVEDDSLYREHWNVLDRQAESEAKRNVLLTGVKNFEVKFYSTENRGEWVSEWKKETSAKERLPKAIAIQLETEHWGAIRRVFALIDNPEDVFGEEQ